MPLFSLSKDRFRLPPAQRALPPPGGRLFGIGLLIIGAGLLAMAAAPMLAGAQGAGVTGPRDPGVRGGPPGAGGPISGLNAAQTAFFQNGLDRFNEVDSVSGTVAGEAGVGLGPRFNMNSCAGCHAQPAVGGSSPAVNPQVAVATRDGAKNLVPSFITSNGPVREARFVHNPDGSPDGGVHDLFTITGRTDASGCTLAQPNFAAQTAAGNVIFRIPTPTFGTGLIESISDATILNNLSANANQKAAAGIGGRVNTTSISGEPNSEGNAGTITRFGWKAQNKSSQIFAGEAYLVEQGVSNELFTQERGEPGDVPGVNARAVPNSCLYNSVPEDTTNMSTSLSQPAVPSDTVQFSTFMRLLAPPQPAPLTGSAQQGQQMFSQVGCNLCHTPSLQTGKANFGGLTNQTANLFSDLSLHDMGSGLADGVSQGNATGSEFRTAPLWGVGQRIFFLHDGRTNDLLQAIEAHASPGSEANTVVNNFNQLSQQQQQSILDFLRSL